MHMSYTLLRPTANGMENVGCFETYRAIRAASQEGYGYTVAEISDDHVEIEDDRGRMLYLITWTREDN